MSGLPTGEIIEELMDNGLTREQATAAAEAYINGNYFDRIQLDDFAEGIADLERDMYEMGEPAGEEFKGLFNVGCKFNGVKDILEYDDKEIYIPSSFHCAIKCYSKYLNIDINTKMLNPYGVTTRKIRYHLIHNCSEDIKDKKMSNIIHNKTDDTYSFDMNKLPEFCIVNTEGKLMFLNKGKQNDCKSQILLFHIKAQNYHAVLIKDYETFKKKYKDNYIKRIKDNIKLGEIKTLTTDCAFMRDIKIREPKRSYYVYDIETCIDGDIKNRMLKPYALAYTKVIMDIEQKFLDNEITMHKDGKKESHLKMIEDIYSDSEEEEIVIFAHNGGCFDNIYVKAIDCDKIKFIEQIKSGGVIKKLVIEYKKKRFIFLDSYLFTLASLKNSAKYFKLPNKISLDIKDKTEEWYDNNEKIWKPYLLQDVRVLALVMKNMENVFLSLSESATYNTGLPSLAWRLMMKQCFGLKSVARAINPVTVNFIHESQYGGRVNHYLKHFKANVTILPNGKTSEGLIALDANNLYPSSMALGMFPIGRFEVYNEEMSWGDFIKEHTHHHFIAEVLFETPNIKRPLMPYRDEEGTLLYRLGKLRGVYNEIDIQEGIRMGYKFLKVYRAVYWVNSAKIFNKHIICLYEKRKKLKSEGNGMEYVYKTTANADYGKFTETINSYTMFTDEEEIRVDKNVLSKLELKNGTNEFTISNGYPIRNKPSHIGSYILSYARRIMNNLIEKVGAENIIYGDTDSVYVPIECIKNIQMDKELGGFKNDYGDGILITEAIFLDLKRYLLRFNKIQKTDEGKEYNFKAKFNGINFKDEKCLRNWNINNSNNIEDEYKVYKSLYKWFLDNPGEQCKISIVQDKWKRLYDKVEINETDMKFQINPDKRAIWKDNISYPIGFDFKKKVDPSLGDTKKVILKKDEVELHYTMSKYGLRCALPLQVDKKIFEKHGIKANHLSVDKNAITDKDLKLKFECSFVIDNNGNIYKRIKEKKTVPIEDDEEELYDESTKTIDVYKFYEMNDNGPIRLVTPPKDYKELLCIVQKTEDKYTPSKCLSEKEFNRLMFSSRQIFKDKFDKNYKPKTIVDELDKAFDEDGDLTMYGIELMRDSIRNKDDDNDDLSLYDLAVMRKEIKQI